MDTSYDVRKDAYFENYISSNNVSDASKEKYAKELAKLCEAMNMEFGEIIKSIKKQQRKRVRKSENSDDYIIVECDVNSPESIINKAQNEFVSFCRKRDNRNVTINNGVITLRSFFNFYGLDLPKWRPLDDDSAEWFRLTKEDFIFVMNDSSLTHKSLITFMLSSGIRIGDCLTFTIGDFMKATENFHDFVDVNDFIDNAPNDMLGYWDFIPKKTKRFNEGKGIRCVTLNSAESSNYIIQNLRRIKNQYLPRKSKRLKEELVMSKNDALFGSHHEKYKKPMTVKSITEQFAIKSHKLHDWRVNKIKHDISEGIHSEEDFDSLVESIPRFHAHGCRKYFVSVTNEYCGNLRLCALMEGHKLPLKTDPSYVDITENMVKDIYLEKLHDHLTLENIETRIITNKETEEIKKQAKQFEEKIEDLLEENRKKDDLIIDLQNRVDVSSNYVQNISKKLESMPQLERFDGGNTDIELHSDILMYIRELILADFHHEHYGEEYPFDIHVNGEDELVITELTYDIIVNNKNSYDGTSESLNKVITKAKLKLKLNPEYRDKVNMEYEILEDEENTLIRISNVIMDKAKEMELFEDDKELELFYSDVLDYVSHNTLNFMGRLLYDAEILEIINNIIG